MKSTVIIKVNEFSLCSSFYREVLKLGEPEVASSFAAIFALNVETMLQLVATDAQFLEHASAATAWSFECDDLPALAARLDDAGFPLDAEDFQLGCHIYRRGADPEGNVFYVKEKHQS